MKTVLSFLIAAFMSTISTHAQEHYNVPKDTQFIQLHSDQTGRDYELLIVLPGSYADSPDKTYPVLYFTDAQWDTSLISNICGKLAVDQVLPEIIRIGITYPGAGISYGDLRSRDLTPVNVPGSSSGDAPKFLKFIEESVIPTVESTYRVDPNKRCLGGVSFGGGFSLYAMYEKPDLFRRFIAISPATQWADEALFKQDAAYAQTNRPLNVRLFITYGSEEYIDHAVSIYKYQKAIANRRYEGLALLNHVAQGERHAGVAIEGWTRGLRWAFQDLNP